MLNEVTGQMQATFSNTPGAGQAQGATGKLIGKAVVEVITPQSILQDAMEEISFNFNKSDDYALKSRKERNRTDSSLKDRLNAYRKVAEKNAADPKKAAEELAQSVEERPEREAILKDALERHEEPADAWAALEEARDLLKQKGAEPAVLRELDEALALMDIRYGAAIRAGITGTLTAAENYVSLGSPLELGSTYRQCVLEFTTTKDLYSFIVNKYGGDFDKAVDFLYASLAADMGCDEPSTDKASLESVNTSLGKLRSFQSAHDQCSKQLQRWGDVHHVQCDMKGIDLLGKILDLGSQSYIGASDAEGLARDAKAADLEHRIFFLQELQQNIRGFSPLVFDKEDGRAHVLDAVQDAVDNAVAEEDAMLAAEES
ncbi:MAG: type III secretion system gatekeeper subunit SctW [Desulfovibrio sp.]|nr:type III secretion system gatekeeper subunit SctW [Desulfovibrio sp.]